MSEDQSQATVNRDLDPIEFQAITGTLVELLSSLEKLQESADKALTNTIAYMDRLVVLGGSTLTLVFVVLGSFGSHLHDHHENARDIPAVEVACWLFILSIVLAVFLNLNLITLQKQIADDAKLQTADAKMKLHLSNLAKNVKALNAPSLPTLDRQKIQRTLKFVNVLVGIARLSVVSAFVCLGFFIQANIRLLLTGK